MTLTGKGYYIWQLKYCENANPDRIAAMAKEANLSHVLIKIADGSFPYNVDLQNGYDYVGPVVKKLQRQNVFVWGWQYVYGDYPDQEAEIAVSRALDVGVDGFVINAEGQYSDVAKAPAASRYMNILRNNLGSMPLALSSYRYPSYHQNLPWVNFLDRCDYNMPQVYWIKSHHNAGLQLQQSVNEFRNMRPFRPIIPTGPTFKQDGWIPYEEEVIEFMNVAKELKLSAVNFWYWEGCRRDMPQFWDLVADYQYDEPTEQVGLVENYIHAINTKDFEAIVKFYADNAVLIRVGSAVQGKDAILTLIESFIKDFSKNKFQLIGQSQSDRFCNFRWECMNDSGVPFEGHDTFGVKDEKIIYHYSFAKQVNTGS